ncbi:iron-containing redox enzyme family protein, partial [Micromonospora sp. ATA51]|uniref:iron-containing redox enzyme family protein n=1 Tax=Micromonospora sp. ATA51 TaxID=2806098 RepID=UPI001EE438AF
MHAELFRRTMDRLGLDSGYAAHLDRVPAVTLATDNLISLFGLHRRLNGPLLGHLAALEMTSSLPNRRYGKGLRRLGWTRWPPASTTSTSRRTGARADRRVRPGAEPWSPPSRPSPLRPDPPPRSADLALGARPARPLPRFARTRTARSPGGW